MAGQDTELEKSRPNAIPDRTVDSGDHSRTDQTPFRRKYGAHKRGKSYASVRVQRSASTDARLRAKSRSCQALARGGVCRYTENGKKPPRHDIFRGRIRYPIRLSFRDDVGAAWPNARS